MRQESTLSAAFNCVSLCSSAAKTLLLVSCSPMVLLKLWISCQRHPSERHLPLPPWHLNPEITASSELSHLNKTSSPQRMRGPANPPSALANSTIHSRKVLSSLVPMRLWQSSNRGFDSLQPSHWNAMDSCDVSGPNAFDG